jgi:AcrR family transcriptional regulator
MERNGPEPPPRRRSISPGVKNQSSAARRGRPPIPGLRNKILVSAIELFGERGFTEVRADEVAAHATVGKGSIYREFGSKEQLYAEAVIEEFRQVRMNIEAALDAKLPATERIATIITRSSKYFWDKSGFFMLLRDPRALPPNQSKRFRKERKQLAGMLARVLREGAATGAVRSDLEFDLVAEAILGMIRGIRRHRQPDLKLEDAVKTVIAISLDGLRVSRPPQRRATSIRNAVRRTETTGISKPS